MDILSFLLEKKLVALLVFTIISVSVAVIITLYEKRPKPRKIEQKESYPMKLDYLLLNRSPEEQLAAITFLFRDFLNKEFGTDPKLELDILEKDFKNNPKISKFCTDLTAAFYSKERIDDKLIRSLSLSLKEIFFEQNPEILIKKVPEKARTRFQKYTSTINPPRKKEEALPATTTVVKQANLRRGIDHHNNLSIFTPHNHAADAKQNISQAKQAVKKIDHSARRSKEGTLNENLSIIEWADSLGKLKNEIINDCKKVISKI
jgi:hypothetical protein